MEFKIEISNKFINIFTEFDLPLKEKPQKQSIKGGDLKLAPNDYKNYIKPFLKEEIGCNDKIKYTIELHKAIFTEEFFEVYKKYELAVHNKERIPDQVKKFLCNSPVFDPSKEQWSGNSSFLSTNLDKDHREFKDEGVFPET